MDNEELGTMLDDCLNRNEKLSQWEQEFLADMYDRFINSLLISQKQQEVIEKIWEKVT